MKKSQYREVVKVKRVKKTAKSKKWIRAKKAKVSRAKNLSLSQLVTFFTADPKRAFTKLRQAFVEAPILNYFDSEGHIQIKMDALSYAISGIFSQLISDDLGQWHPVVFFSRKMFLTETWYETHNGELLAIIEVFKTWKHYLKGCKHEILVLTNDNNLQRFMDRKILRSK